MKMNRVTIHIRRRKTTEFMTTVVLLGSMPIAIGEYGLP